MWNVLKDRQQFSFLKSAKPSINWNIYFKERMEDKRAEKRELI